VSRGKACLRSNFNEGLQHSHALQELDIAIVKATNHDPVVPKQKHVVSIYNSCGRSDSSRETVRHLLVSLSERAQGSSEWLVVLKCLMVVHRLMREAEGERFRSVLAESLFGSRGRDNGERRRDTSSNSGPSLALFNLGGFKDESSPEAWEMSGWVRAYALYLEERVSVLADTRCDPQSETQAGPSCVSAWNMQQLMAGLPRLQALLRRLTDALPRLPRLHPVAAAAAADCLREVRLLYRAVSEAVLNLVDKFFDMAPQDAAAALDMYRRAARQVQDLNGCLGALRQHEQLAAEMTRVPYPFNPPPSDFQKVMEDYINGGAGGGGGGGGGLKRSGSLPGTGTGSPPVFTLATQQQHLSTQQQPLPAVPPRRSSEAAARGAEVDLFGTLQADFAPAPAAAAAPVRAQQQQPGLFDLLGGPSPAAAQAAPAFAPTFAPTFAALAPVPAQPPARAPLNLDSLYAAAPGPAAHHPPYGAVVPYGLAQPQMGGPVAGFGGASFDPFGGPTQQQARPGSASTQMYPGGYPQQPGVQAQYRAPAPPQSAYGAPPPAPYGSAPLQQLGFALPAQQADPFAAFSGGGFGGAPPAAAAAAAADPFSGLGAAFGAQQQQPQPQMFGGARPPLPSTNPFA